MTLLNILQFVYLEKNKSNNKCNFFVATTRIFPKTIWKCMLHLQKDIFFNHVSSSKWGQIMFKVASQLSYLHCFHKIDEIVSHSVGLELN